MPVLLNTHLIKDSMRLKIEQISMAVLSFCVLLLELTETRLLSFVFWNHMVYLCLSIALLGFGIGGTFLAVFGQKLGSRRAALSFLIAGFALTTSLVFLSSLALPVFGVQNSPAKVLFCYTVFSLPFIFAGAAISLILSEPQCDVGQLYAIDLISAGLACFLFFFLLPALGPQLLIAAMVACLAGIAYWWAPKQKSTTVFAAINVVAAATVLFLPGGGLTTENYKELFQIVSVPGSKIDRTVWTPLCRIDIASNNQASMHSHTYHLPAGGGKAITQDGTADTVLPGAKGIAMVLDQIKNDTPTLYAPSLPYRIKKNPKVAVIGVGGGIEIVHAVGYGAKQITGAEINPVIYKATTSTYSDFTNHFFQQPQIRIINEEARSMLRQLDEKFDVIQFVAIDTFAALSNGAYVLSENYLYTVEAMNELLDHLEPNGIICCLRWQTDPPAESLRLTALACEALKNRGCKTIDQQIMVVQQEGWALNLIKQSPFTPDEVKTIEAAARRHSMEILYIPKVFGSDQQTFEKAYYDGLPAKIKPASNTWNQMVESYQKGSERQFFATYLFELTPTTDDHPFFFEYHHKNVVGADDWSLNELRGNSSGMTLNMIMIQSLMFTIFAMILPLLRFKRTGLAVPHAFWFSIYFAAIGFGFMLIEVSLIQKCVLFLGSPLYSLSAVLATLLITAGLGSALVTRTHWATRKVMLVFGGSFLLFFVALTFAVNPLIYSLISQPLWVRILITVLMVAPAGVLLGVFFPTGLRALKNNASDYLPWAWGINGCTSVYGSFAAICLAISFGFTITMLAGAAAYIPALIAGWRFGAEEKTN
jgi:predicted membrane-bound spermidine synthase